MSPRGETAIPVDANRARAGRAVNSTIGRCGHEIVGPTQTDLPDGQISLIDFAAVILVVWFKIARKCARGKTNFANCIKLMSSSGSLRAKI